jgi:hypothetical protein
VRHFHEETPICYTFIEVPVKMIPENAADLNDNEALKRFRTTGSTKPPRSALSRLTFSIAEENIICT